MENNDEVIVYFRKLVIGNELVNLEVAIV